MILSLEDCELFGKWIPVFFLSWMEDQCFHLKRTVLIFLTPKALQVRRALYVTVKPVLVHGHLY